tara:strand:- start:454 stop:861 length:408 start_codon:yes stop_codon:yes gene_type:complete
MNYLEHNNLMEREIFQLVSKYNSKYWSDLDERWKEYLYGLHAIMVADPRDIYVESDNENVIDILKQLANGDTSNLARLPSLLRANKDAYYEAEIGRAYDDQVNNHEQYCQQWYGDFDDQTDMASSDYENLIKEIA